MKFSSKRFSRAQDRSHSQALYQQRTDGGIHVSNGVGGCRRRAGTARIGGEGRPGPLPLRGAPEKVELERRRRLGSAPGTRVSEGWAPGQRVTTWGKCGLLKGRATRCRSAGAGFPARPRRPSSAQPQERAEDCPRRRPGAPWAELTLGSPRLPPRGGQGDLARCRLRADPQVSTGTGRTQLGPHASPHSQM